MLPAAAESDGSVLPAGGIETAALAQLGVSSNTQSSKVRFKHRDNFGLQPVQIQIHALGNAFECSIMATKIFLDGQINTGVQGAKKGRTGKPQWKNRHALGWNQAQQQRDFPLDGDGGEARCVFLYSDKYKQRYKVFVS